MSKYTPGPWGYFSVGWEAWVGVKTGGSTLHVATIPRAPDGDWSSANARLIAAAPELLEALKHAAEMIDEDLIAPAAMKRINDIIAKAEGTEQRIGSYRDE